MCCILLYYIYPFLERFSQRSQPQQLTLCRSLHAKALQSTVSEGLAQGPYVYVAARAGFEPTTLRSKRLALSVQKLTTNGDTGSQEARGRIQETTSNDGEGP